MSTKFPSSALLMELSSFLKKRKIKALVSNREGDALANGHTNGFNPEVEMVVDGTKLRWCVLPDALEAGRQAKNVYRDAKEHGRLPRRLVRFRLFQVQWLWDDSWFVFSGYLWYGSTTPDKTSILWGTCTFEFLFHSETQTLIFLATFGVSSTTPKRASVPLCTKAPGVSPPLRPQGRTGVFHR